MTIKNNLEGTLAALIAAISAITPAAPEDSVLLDNAKNQISGKLSALANANAADPAAPNGALISLVVDGKNFRCAFIVTPKTILV